MIETRLHILLAEKRMTQKDLAEATGIGKNTINRYCNNTWSKINKEDINSCIRITLSGKEEIAELNKFCEVLKRCVETLRQLNTV